jgi:hypothetical protein
VAQYLTACQLAYGAGRVMLDTGLNWLINRELRNEDRSDNGNTHASSNCAASCEASSGVDDMKIDDFLDNLFCLVFIAAAIWVFFYEH